MPRLLLLLVTSLLFQSAVAQELKDRPPTAPPPSGAAMAANSDAIYQQLRHITVSGETVPVSEFVLKRDAGSFTFHSGAFYFLAPVKGKVTGAVFVGDGSFSLNPPTPGEVRSLSLLTRSDTMAESFNSAVFRFTDTTYDEIKKQNASNAVPAAGGSPTQLLDDIQRGLRTRTSPLRYNLNARILEDLLSDRPGGLFYAFIKGKKYSSKMLYAVDPHGLTPLHVAPDEVALMTYEEMKWGIWTSFHLADEYAGGAASGDQRNEVIKVDSEKLDTTIEKNARLSGDAVTSFTALSDGVRVVPLNLFPTLRVQSVADAATGQWLAFIQEDKDEDPDFFVILPKALASGEHFTIHTIYSGKDAVRDEGNDNYFPVARHDWYPAGRMGDFSTYEITFRIPKGLTMVATGTRLRDVNEGDQNITEWRSDAPQPVAGFNFGKFKHDEAKLNSGFVVETYANAEQPSWVRDIESRKEMRAMEGGLNRTFMGDTSIMGTMNTVVMMKKPLAEAELAVGLYSDYFGPPSFKSLAMTQQTACNYGQSWPELVYLPICSFYDSTVRHQLGLDDTRGYWTIVAPHEVAHQWWGHTVSWGSYRDQWMSEGFADFSASLFIQSVYSKEPQRFMRFWQDERELLIDRNREGFRAIDIGPVTGGYRLGTTRSGFSIPRHLIYPKGAYIAHMLRMMMWDSKTGDANFKDMMHDFAHTYAGRIASTEDFKAMVEKHMTPTMSRVGNGTMDWFFNEYVYGTALPHYDLNYSFHKGPDGGTVLSFKLSQSGVGKGFIMPVPIYLELADGRVARLGVVPLTGEQTLEKQVSLGKLKDPPRRAMINYYYDVLSD